MKVCVYLLMLIVAFGLGSCNLFTENDPPEIYTGGNVYEVEFEIMGPHQVRLIWNDTFEDEDGFYIDKKVWDGEWQEKLVKLSGDVHTWLDVNVELGTVYYYKVYAYKGDSVSEEEQVQYNFYLPAPADMDWDFSWSNPTRLNFTWINLAEFADRIVVAKRLEGEEWTPNYAILEGDATAWTDASFDVSVTNTWGFTAYYQDQISNQYTVTIMPPK